MLQFSGDLSLENNGGFSQMRCDVSGDRFAGMRGIEITVRGDGRKYNFDVRCANARVRAGGFQRSFATTDSEWTTIRIRPVHRAHADRVHRRHAVGQD
ncbi:MAG: CIA30 family protein [Planctomycetota bacterium]